MSKKYEIKQSRATTWFKLHSENYLWGSTRSELNPDERAVWVDFLCLATMNFGEVEVFSRDQLAQQLLIDRKLLDRSIEKFLKFKKIRRKPYKKEKKEVFIVRNWGPYQADYLTKRQKKSNAYPGNERIEKTGKYDAENEPILEKRRGENITLKEITSKDSISENAKSFNTQASEGSSPLSLSSDAVVEEEKSIKETFLSKLKGIPDYPYDDELDSMLFDDIETACPGFDILKHLDEEASWLIGDVYLKTVSDPRKAIKGLLKLDYEEEKR